jgi:hypothetical protein
MPTLISCVGVLLFLCTTLLGCTDEDLAAGDVACPANQQVLADGACGCPAGQTLRPDGTCVIRVLLFPVQEKRS